VNYLHSACSTPKTTRSHILCSEINNSRLCTVCKHRPIYKMHFKNIRQKGQSLAQGPEMGLTLWVLNKNKVLLVGYLGGTYRNFKVSLISAVNFYYILLF
jgi:hypothetical protein